MKRSFFEFIGDVLVWSDVDKCLMLAIVTLPFDFAFWYVSGSYIGFPEIAPWANQDYLPVIRFASGTVTLIWLAVIATGLAIRQRDPQNQWLVQFTIFHWYLGTVYMIHCFGAATSPVGLSVVGGAIVGVMLWDLRRMAPALIVSGVALVLMTVADRLGWIPYAPLTASSPLVDGQVATVWFAVVMGLFVTMSVGIGLVGVTAVLRWREREAEVAEMSDFLRRTFGRYLSPELMRAVLENPKTVELGGQMREVTMVIADVRGFTQLSERLDPKQVVSLLNRYLCDMMEVCERYQGTVNDIVGDQILVTFGAPEDMPDHARVAVACSIEMQNAMKNINEKNRAAGLPNMEIGIGLNTAEVVVGNIGSERRSKYGVVGAGVNLTSRIESYSVGGQILASQSLVDAAGDDLRIDHHRQVLPKGAPAPIIIYEIGGMSGRYNISLETVEQRWCIPENPIELRYTPLGGKHVGTASYDAKVIRISATSADLGIDGPLDDDVDLMFNLANASPHLAQIDFYGKVVRRDASDPTKIRVAFTALPPEIAAFFEALLITSPEPQ